MQFKRFLLFFKVFFLFCLLQTSLLPGVESYNVTFEGDIPADTLDLLKKSSQLVESKKNPSFSLCALKRRKESDEKNLLKALHSKAYYGASVDITIDEDACPPAVTVKVDTGPVFSLAAFKIVPANPSAKNIETQKCLYEKISLKDLCISIGQTALPKAILEAEEALLLLIGKQGYPLANIEKREIIADQACHTISITLLVESGPLTYFGLTTFSGLVRTKESFVRRKIYWKQGCVYNPLLLEKSLAALEASGLFSAINFQPAENVTDCDQLPITIQLKEGKPRSIGAGVAFATQRGPGVTAEWEHRNLWGKGEKLAFTTTLWGDLQEVIATLTKPDFKKRGQDLIFAAELEHEVLKGYTESSLTLSAIIERQLNDKTKASLGLRYKRLTDSHAENDGNFNLFKVPFNLRYSDVKNMLDPTFGNTLQLKIIPSVQFLAPMFSYCFNLLTYSVYLPLKKDERIVVAAKFTLGSIFGASDHAIPSSELFYEGSDNTLRGYRYRTVSPLRPGTNKPIGGRSVAVITSELRIRTGENLGWVAFYDMGNVYAEPLPQFDQGVLRAAGIGIRYYTPVGPIRLDVAFPFTPRPGLDSKYQLYLSIGQTF